jgi:hypothetical protein
VTTIVMFLQRKVFPAKKERAEDDKSEPLASEAAEGQTTDDVLRSGVYFGTIMMLFWLLDGKQVLPIQQKHYSRDFFLFLMFVVLAYSWPVTITCVVASLYPTAHTCSLCAVCSGVIGCRSCEWAGGDGVAPEGDALGPARTVFLGCALSDCDATQVLD